MKVVKENHNISGLEIPRLIKQYTIWKTIPVGALGEGPKFKTLFVLLIRHYLGGFRAYIETRHNAQYRLYVRIRKSVVFRFNRYRRKIKGLLASKTN